MLPEAPATFSMMTDCPSEGRMPSAIMRAIVSVGPPAGNGTTTVTGRAGYVCATPLSANATTAETAIEIRSILREYMGAVLLAHCDAAASLRWWPRGDCNRPVAVISRRRNFLL